MIKKKKSKISWVNSPDAENVSNRLIMKVSSMWSLLMK